MAIIFSEEKKRQQLLILVFIVVVLATAVIFWAGVFQKPEEFVEPEAFLFSKKLEINFETLESSIVSELELFKEISPFEGTVGRENPFLP